jgi:3-hydroxyacyl-CoA dehydrogenase
VVLAKELQGSLIDRCVDPAHVVDDAVAFARELIDSSAPLRRLRDLPLWPASDLIAAARERAPASASRYAPAVIVDCVEAASRPVDEGLRYERERFQELVNNEESQRLRREFLDRTA